MVMAKEKSRAEVYDELRRRFPNIGPPDLLVLTQGVSALIRMGGPNASVEVLDTTELGNIIRGFGEFSEENDPWGEHDFGSFTFRGEKLFWKVDDYAGQDGYRYVLTVLLADEY